jgi:hypothetical protein
VSAKTKKGQMKVITIPNQYKPFNGVFCSSFDLRKNGELILAKDSYLTNIIFFSDTLSAGIT